MKGSGGFLQQVMLQHAVVLIEGIQRPYLASIRATCPKIQHVWSNPKVQSPPSKAEAGGQLHDFTH